MARKNFGRVSGIVLDECPAHGTFFDAGELADVVAFVKSGGLALSAKHEAREQAWEREQRGKLNTPERTNPYTGGKRAGLGVALGNAYAGDTISGTSLVDDFAHWARGWLNRILD